MKSLSLRTPATSTRLLVAGLVLAIAGTAALTVQAQPGPGGAGHHHRGEMGMGLPMFGGHIDRMLDSVKASDAQRAQIKEILAGARADMKAQRESGRALREQMQALFTQPTVDANAAEALRQQMLSRHDQASKRMMQAMLDVSRVLTPEQRQQLAQQMKQRRDLMERHMRERRQLEGGQPGK